VTDEATRNGEFKRIVEDEGNEQSWTIYLHDFSYPFKEFRGFPVRLEIEEGLIEKIEAPKNGGRNGDENKRNQDTDLHR